MISGFFLPRVGIFLAPVGFQMRLNLFSIISLAALNIKGESEDESANPKPLNIVNKRLSVHGELCRNNYLWLSLPSPRMVSMASSQSKSEPDVPDGQLVHFIMQE